MSKKKPPNYVPAGIDLLLDPNLTPTDKLINLYLKWRQGRNGEAWPGLDLIGKEVGGLSESTVRRSIKRQKNHGWLKVVRPSGQGRGIANRYTATTPKKGSTDDTLSGKKGITSDGKRVSPVTGELIKENYIHTNGEESFETFWKSYPPRNGRKQDKRGARDRWCTLKPDEQLFCKIMNALERQKQSREWQKDNGQFIPDARKWLRNRRWEDEIDTQENQTAPLARDAEGLTPRDKLKAQLERK